MHPIVRRSPYFEATEAEGAVEYMVYNHMYMPMDYGRDPREDYAALTQRVTLWDVGAERQTAVRGPDAVRFTDLLCTRDLRDLETGACRYSPVCDASGTLLAECVVLRPYDDTLWISHGDVDLTLWAQALALEDASDVQVEEPDVAPLQLQGPSSLPVLVSLIGSEIEHLAYYACRQVRVAGVDVVVSRTGWSREMGFELFPISPGRELDLWQALVRAGREQGLLVTGPNLVRACEQGITDNCYAVNDGMTPFEAGVGWAVDLEADTFVGRDALMARREPARHTIGFVANEPQTLPRLESFWPLDADGMRVGYARWAVNSIALDRPIAIVLVDAGVDIGSRATLLHPEGSVEGRLTKVPFV